MVGMSPLYAEVADPRSDRPACQMQGTFGSSRRHL